MGAPDVPASAGPFPFKFHQIAMYTNDQDGAVEQYSGLGFEDWSFDSAMLQGYLRQPGGGWAYCSVDAQMAFNYQVLPLELEFLTYLGPHHRHVERARLSSVPFISHMSAHVHDVVQTMRDMDRVFGMQPYHVFVTAGHSNQAIEGIKRFVECIYDTRDILGYDIKCIERIDWESEVSARDLILEGLQITTEQTE